MATEPKTTVNIIDETIGLGNDPVDTSLNILCPIISPTGPTKLTRVTGPSMLRRFFNGGSAITPDSSQTLQYARAVSAQAPLYIKRASRGEIRGGKSVTDYGTVFYVDALGNPISGGILKLTQSIPVANQYSTLLTALHTPDAIVIERTDDLVYISENEIPVGQGGALVKKSVKYVPTQGNFVQFVGDSATAAIVRVTVNNTEYTLTAGKSDLNEIATAMIDDGEKPIAIGGTDVYYDQTTNTLNIKPSTGKVTFIAFATNVTLTYNNNADKTKVVKMNTEENTPVFYINTIASMTDYNENYVTTPFSFHIDTATDTFHIHTSDVDYINTYKHNISIPNDLSFNECCRAIYDELDPYLTLGANSQIRFIIPDLATVANITIPNPGGGDPLTPTLTASKDSSFEIPSADLFGIISKFPNETDSIKVKSVDNGDDTYTLTINAFGDEEVFTISFVPGAVDGYGNDIYYTNVDSNSDYVSVIPLGGTQVASEIIFDIGSQVKNEFVGIPELFTALEDMMDTEESPVLFDYILDGGVVDNSYSSMIIKACEYYKAFYPASCQVDSMSVANMKSNRDRLGKTQLYCRANFIAAAQRDSVLDSGIVTMPASYYYLVHRIGLAQSVQEFVAVFGRNNGDIGITNPIKDFKKSDRESMMDSQIVTLKRSMGDGVWYLNLNMTCYGVDSYLQEDGIVLMCNKIAQVAMSYAETLKSEYNTPELRSQVTGTLTQYINSRLRVGTAYGPNSITVICDDSNNTKNTIGQRKLIIDIYGRFANSIKDVLIYEHVQPLEG